MEYPVCILTGYLVGTINPAYFIARLRGFDIRKKGSGNAGASNALILFGKLRGALCALLDIAKAAFIILLMDNVFPDFTYSFVLTGASCILGHIFPFYMRFRGGKGLACLAGTVLAYDWRVFLIMFAVEIVIALVTKYICFVPMTAAIVFPFLYGSMRRDLVGFLVLGVVAAVILYRHKENIVRIREGKEMRLTYLWNKKKETERLEKHYPTDV